MLWHGITDNNGHCVPRVTSWVQVNVAKPMGKSLDSKRPVWADADEWADKLKETGPSPASCLLPFVSCLLPRASCLLSPASRIPPGNASPPPPTATLQQLKRQSMLSAPLPRRACHCSSHHDAAPHLRHAHRDFASYSRCQAFYTRFLRNLLDKARTGVYVLR